MKELVYYITGIPFYEIVPRRYSYLIGILKLTANYAFAKYFFVIDMNYSLIQFSLV